MTEAEFENSPNPGQNEPVAINQKHAYKTVVVPSHLNSEPSPSEVIDRPVAFENGGGIKNLDKINNLVQKEISLSKVGVTREKAYAVIARALDAHKWADVIDRQGNVKSEWVPDLEKQKWGAEMAIKMFGDMIERKEIEMDVGDKTLDRFRAMSVADLKAKAADLLLGRRGAVDAELINK